MSNDASNQPAESQEPNSNELASDSVGGNSGIGASEAAASEQSSTAGERAHSQDNAVSQEGGDPIQEASKAAVAKKKKVEIGSRRGKSASEPTSSKPNVHKPKASTKDLTPPPLPPKPSRRDALTPELEKEINDALGGLSLDQIGAPSEATELGEGLELESRHRAAVVKIHKDDVFFSLGGRNEGVASLRQFPEPPKPGDMLEVIVHGVNDEDGLYELTIPGASIVVGDWSDLVEGATVEARITGSNTGGLECMVNNIRGFIPVSQVALYRVDNMDEFVDQKYLCVVTEVNPQKQNLVLSRRAVLEREKEESRQELLQQIEVGQIREGIVRNIRDFGAFVDIGGLDGLIHISKLSWDRIKHPSEVLEEGQKIKVKIEKIDPATGKIGLSFRDLLDNPWSGVEQKYSVGSIVSGAITRVAKFGAFMKLEPGVEGLIHISELAHRRVTQPGSIVSEGQQVEAKVLSVDSTEQRISLSLKALSSALEASSNADDADDEPLREMAVPQRRGPLKGGRDRPSGGDQFGLNW